MWRGGKKTAWAFVCSVLCILCSALGCASGEQYAPQSAEERFPESLKNRSLINRIFGSDPVPIARQIVDSIEAKSLVTRGEYLANSAAACGSCHGAEPERPGSSLSGGRLMSDSFGLVHAPNITPDPETGIGKWSLTEVMRAIRSSIGVNERPLSLELHKSYRWMSDSDTKALAAYLFSLEPVQSQIERRELGRFQRKKWGLFSRHRDIQGYVPEPSRNKGVAYGRYLTRHVAQCVTCHTPEGGFFSNSVSFSGVEPESRSLVFALSAAKAALFGSEIDESSAQLLSPESRREVMKQIGELDEVETTSRSEELEVVLADGEFPLLGPDIRGQTPTGLVDWEERDIVEFLSSGETAEGVGVDSRLCPWPFYKQMDQVDKEAIAKYLKSLSL